MSRSLALRLSLSMALCAIAPAAWADVTAADVWQNMNAPIEAMGASVSATATQNNGITTYNDIAYTFTLPMGIGGGTLTSPTIALIENGDGTVSLQYPREMILGFNGFIAGEGDVSAHLRFQTEQTIAMTASGRRGDITYYGTTGNMQMSLDEVTMNGAPLDGVSMTADFQASSTIEQRIIEGDLVEMTLLVNRGPSSLDMIIRYDDPQGGLITQQTSEYAGGNTQIEIALPAGGSDLMNLAPALAQGLSFFATAAHNGTQNRQTITSDLGIVISNQATASGSGTLVFSVDADGLFADVEMSSVLLEMIDPDIPFPVNIDAGNVHTRYEIPLSARPEAQDFGLLLDIDALRLGPAIWDLFDPAKEMDRTPANIALDIAGSAVLNADVTNFLDFGMRVDSGQMVASIEDLQLRAFELGALGATATATAALTFDNTDWTTYPGIPKPVGGFSFAINGLNAALDQFIAAGSISSDEIFGIRMMLGMVSTASGDDGLSGTIQLGEDGSISANGQRIR